MIVFNLSCNNDHRFEGWFESSAKFEAQRDARLVSCPVCGTDQISKELHAPYVNTGAGSGAPVPRPAADCKSEQQIAVFQKVFTQFVEHVLANTEDVGDAFPEEARKIHYQEAPERAIRGNASGEDIAELQEEGIEVVAVPIPKNRLGNPH